MKTQNLKNQTKNSGFIDCKSDFNTEKNKSIYNLKSKAMRTFKLFFVLLLSVISFALSAQTTDQDTVCVNAANVQYYVTNTAGSSYAWSVTGGGTISSGQGTNSILINWGGKIGRAHV